MDRNLLKRFIRTAIISSPIIALYGATPFYLFSKVQPSSILFAGLIITMNVFIFWAINIFIIRYSGVLKNWKWYLYSYAFVVTFHIIIGIFRKMLMPPAFITEGESTFGKDTLMIYPFISLLAINTIIIIICNSILATQKSKDAEIEIQELKVSNLEAQKQVLLQQLQPHFLFNTLSVLKSLIKAEPEEAENYSIKLSNFLRYSLEVHNCDLVSVEQELIFTNDYIDLQKTRFESSVIFSVNIPHEIYNMQIPAYALQTLVENAIKHNSFTERRPLSIKINYIGNDTIFVCNNKLPVKAVDTTGTGLKNLNQRYKIIAHKEIEITDSQDEFSVKVFLLNNHQI
jgi:sensor histidine kinase YesM